MHLFINSFLIFSMTSFFFLPTHLLSISASARENHAIACTRNINCS
ncbi:MAG: hypothetical protein WCG25_06665 [bacterium]